MLRILNRPAREGWASVSSFAKRTWDAIFRDVSAKNGAIVRHGPHQGAQKSTTTGKVVRLMCRSNVDAVRSTGEPSKAGRWHLGQRGDSARRPTGTRTTASQCP